MAEAYSDKVIASGLSFGGIRTYVWASEASNTDTTYTINFGGSVQSIACSQYSYWFEIESNGTQGNQASGSTSNSSNASWKTEQSISSSASFTKNQSAYTVSVKCYAQFSSATSRNCTATVNVTIPARTRTAHGNPTIKTSDSGVLQGDEATISWAKSSTQGNANFDHFELWQQKSKEYNSKTDKKLYSGSGTSYVVTPSDFVGTDGGDVFYVVYEYHEWYDSHPYTSAAVAVHVMPTMAKPTVTIAKSTVNYSEKIKISWSTSNTAGTLSKYQLYQGANTVLYEGAETSCDVIPSETSGPQGGTVTYTLVENRTWYSKSTSASNTVQVKVRSGVCTVYDSSSNKRTALVTAYDSKGMGHYVLITAYDSNGKAHNVV